MRVRSYLMCFLMVVFLGSWIVSLGAEEEAPPARASDQEQAEEEEVPAVYPTAILTFEEWGSGVKDYGAKIGGIVFASLATNPDLILVDRADLEKQLEELELSLSGMVKPKEAIQVGQLTGAKILVTGSVFQTDSTLYLVAKIIGTETSRVLGASVKGEASDGLEPLVEKLAEEIASIIERDAERLVAKELEVEDRIAALMEALGDAQRPAVLIDIGERHIGEVKVDPAAETEFVMFCRETGFDIIDSESGGSDRAEVVIEGEGFSEFAMRRGDLVIVKARLEVRAIDAKTGNVIAADRQTTVILDLTEQIAGKMALQKASGAIAERLLPKLVDRGDAGEEDASDTHKSEK